MFKVRRADVPAALPSEVRCHLLDGMWQSDLKHSAPHHSDPHQSEIKHSTLEHSMPQNKAMRVLDVGSAGASTVNFFGRNFNQRHCYLAFPDLYAEPFISGSQPDMARGEIISLFTAALKLKPDVSLDVCLFWDFFSYLRAPYIAAMLEALRPHLSAATRGYCLGAMRATPMPHYHYGLAGPDTITQVPRGGAPLRLYTHTQADLAGLLAPFVISKSRLMEEGRLECLLVDRSVAPVVAHGAATQF
jgi:hypothetical protein